MVVPLQVMDNSLYKPFDRFDFNEKSCYLTGKPAELKTVFPEWLLEKFGLGEKLFKFLDENITTYRDVKVPTSAEAELAFAQVDRLVEDAFEAGYDGLKNLDTLILFQWIAKLLYGTIHTEIRAGIKQQRASGEPFNFSQSLIVKFGNLHTMLQSLTLPVVFEGVSPWSVKVFKLTEEQPFSYRDEINTLVFSMKIKDCGIIACLQDNGESLSYHREVLRKINQNPLHPIQFEEICARFFYSAYLFNRLPEYTVLQTPDEIFIEAMPLRISSKPVYDEWQVKTYGQVLENFWKPWGLLLFEIIKDPENPMSFLLDDQGEFIPADSIKINDIIAR